MFRSLMSRIVRISTAILLVPVALATLGHPAAATAAIAVCPAVGADSTCGTVITITRTGATVTATGQGPYDGIDDTLVGIVNNSKLPVTVLGLKSGLDIFGFDGDGIDTYGVPGNSLDTSGYGGPNAYYTDINASQTSGQVNFITPVAAGGGTSYFSLENALSSSVACGTLINNALSSPHTSGSSITDTFTPKLGYSLSTAAQYCGFLDFDWQQTITSWPLPSTLFQINNPKPLHAPPPFLDPAPGGYTYTGLIHDYPFYFDWTNTSGGYGNGFLNLENHQNGNTLDFGDSPRDPCLPGGTAKFCGGTLAPKGSVLAFKTHLVGVNSDGTSTDLGIGFTWKSTYNGNDGRTARTLDPPGDPGSGTGSVTITGVDESSDYQYDGVTVNAVNPTQITGSHPGTLIVTGTTVVSDAQIGGAIVVESGASLDLEDSTVGGAVTAIDSPGAIRICGSTVSGHTDVSNPTSLYLGAFGDPNCSPDNFIGGTLFQ